MTTPAPHEVTQLLAQARAGDAGALDRLLPLVYAELRALAHRQRLRQGAAETLNTTALVHEAYEKLAHAGTAWSDRAHFFRVAARAMRQVLVDYARARTAAKRGGDARPLPLDEADLLPLERANEVVALDEALGRLSALDPRQGEVVELRYFVGLTIPETAEVLGLSPATVKREWTAARAWLYREMTRAA
ncbi:MAG TPA: sigma-70 family RNA polymerase sigma factor [Rubricoccaceae bacterium]|jgi:RNA polymerase sigma factor (TIGR02999 family)|nr:sigma-70 family RNA polymerase sigma factor [Rubricoccaceae bacterium]